MLNVPGEKAAHLGDDFVLLLGEFLGFCDSTRQFEVRKKAFRGLRGSNPPGFYHSLSKLRVMYPLVICTHFKQITKVYALMIGTPPAWPLCFYPGL